MTLAGLFFAASPSIAVPMSPPPATIEGEPIHGAIAASVGRTLLQGHYGGQSINDDLSRAWLDAYIDVLDYSRLYFLASDIREFDKWSTTLDDDIQAKEPQLDAAWAIHRRFTERVDERMTYALKALETPITFDKPKASIDLDRHEDAWATSSDELDALWQARLTDQLLRMELAETTTTNTPTERLKRRYIRVQKEAHSLYTEDVLEMYLGALTRIFDPHSVWFKPITKQNFDIDMSDTLTGIGAQLRSEDGYTVITGLIAGGPAEASEDLSPNDKILAVGQGRTGEPVDIVDMRIDRVVQLIRGAIDTEVHLVIHPGDATDPAETKDVYLLRDRVKLSQSAASGEIREVEVGGQPAKVGVIDVPSFYVDHQGMRAGDADYGSTTRDVAKILADFNNKNVGSVVIDLRQNGGGSLDQAIDLTGLFLPGGPVVQIRDRENRVNVREDSDPAVAWDKPVVVLTSELSASASEIFAAALQDHGRGLVVGAKSTHGKGSVQNLISLERYLRRTGTQQAEKSGALKFTTHMFFRVNGDSTQIKGVRADIPIPSPFEGMEIKEGDLDHPLPWDSIASARFFPQPASIDVQALAEASKTRVDAAPEFSYIQADIATRLADEADDQLSLHLDTRRREIEEAKSLVEGRDEARKKRGWDGESDIDPILDEAVHIASDILMQRR
jgi:carboxyl-terminal processing protease